MADMKYFPDITRLEMAGDHLWVFTSDGNSEGAQRVDRFHVDDGYLDSFYLTLPGRTDYYRYLRQPVALNKKTIWTVEQDSDMNPVLVKYGIPGDF
jgi:hypothetical protein